MEPPVCFLCYKKPDENLKGDWVFFADFVELGEDYTDDEVAPGFKWFCGEHLAVAGALAHLTSEEALLRLQQQFGKFERPVVVPPKPTKWQRLCDRFWNWI
ncbi:MAG: hypothetical protein LBU53_03630 [Zoogloeaceae bacterium]|jgi:hypothetical protein|nr:hypothetical protein [Zoogloeaceae bacterium]